MHYTTVQQTDEEVYKLIKKEEKRQLEGIELIPSENYTSRAVLEAVGSIMIDKYSEGYPKKRYYGGNKHVDAIEIIAQERAKKLFHVPHANVQPYSGSPANVAVYFAVCMPGDPVMGQYLYAGGHLTHGWKVSITGKYFTSFQYELLDNGEIDFETLEQKAHEIKPKLIWCGATAYTKQFDFKRFATIADSVGAYFAADISHISGLILAGVHPSPVDYADIITTTTHKTLRGPRGAMIMVTKKGLEKDPDLATKIDRSVFPGSQGGPHDNTTAGIAITLKEADSAAFQAYGKQIVINASKLARALIQKGFTLVGNGTENHMILIDLRPAHMNGWHFEKALEQANITVNKNTIPHDPSSPFYPSGIRLGTPAVTTRGMKEKHMEIIAEFLARVRDILFSYPGISEVLGKSDVAHMRKFRRMLKNDTQLAQIKKEVAAFTYEFPIPGVNI